MLEFIYTQRGIDVLFLTKKTLRLLILLTAIAGLSACGGGGGSSSGGNSDVPATLSGMSAKGIITNGVVTAYEVDLSGVDLRTIGTTSTSATGQYSLSLSDTYEGGVIRVEVTLGTTTKMVCDVFDGCDGVVFGGDMDLPAGFAMEAFIAGASINEIINVQITPLTHMAAARVRAGEVTSTAVANAYSEISQVVGVDVQKTPMPNIANAAELESASAASKQYALFNAGVAKQLGLASGTGSLNDNLNNLAESFEDGEFTSGDSVTITDILNDVKSAATSAKSNSTTTEVMSDSINAIEAAVQNIEDNVIDNGYNPEPSDNYSPLVSAGSDIQANLHEEVTLDASGSSDSDGTIVSYEWKVGEAVLSNSEAASFKYADFPLGTNTVTLTITDNNGAIAIDTVVVIINDLPVADAGADQAVNVGDVVTLDASGSTDSDGTIESYEWKEGDTVLNTEESFTTSELSEGQHTITLTVTDNNGATATDTVVVNVNYTPVANAGSDITVIAGAEVAFDASASTDSDGNITGYQWKEGETVLSTAASFTKSDFTAGTHTITLTVTDDGGATATDTVVVKINIPPVANAGADNSGNMIDIITLDASASTDSDGTIASYQWKEGETVLSTAASFTKSDFTVGAHTVTLTVTDNDGATNADSVVITIINASPVAKAGSDVTTNISEAVALNASASTDVDGTIVSYEWKEGEAVLSTVASFDYSQSTVGVHTITLTVTDNGGATNTDTVDVTINNPPTAEAGENQAINWGEDVTLNASGSSDSDGTIASYQWSEGENDLADGINFTTSELSAGEHTITLTVTDNNGATDTDTVVVAINVLPVAVAGDNAVALVDEKFQLDASGSSDSDGTIESYQWKEDEEVLSDEVSFEYSASTEGVHTITLTVTDDDGATNTDTVTVTVNAPPVANAGADISAKPRADVILDASASTDNGGTIASYQWSKNGETLSTDAIYTASDLDWGFHTITLTVTDNLGAIDTDDILVTIEKRINDTGITRCANADDNYLNCSQDGFPNQDAEHGRDALAQAGELEKIGAGAAGFDYTKICNSGEAAGEGDCPANPALGDGANDWACTRDNVTDLIWEVKTTSGLRSKDNTYTWYNADSNTNGGHAGTQNGGSCTGSDCDTQEFVQAVNAAGLCGATDWRMPNIFELKGILYIGIGSKIDLDYFPNNKSSSSYLSSSPYANFKYEALSVYFAFGNSNIINKKIDKYVRLVHSNSD